MFKARIKGWGLLKNLRRDEALAMTRVKAHREVTNTPCEFWRHGRLVSPQKLERFLRDNPNVVDKAKSLASEDQAGNSWIEAILPSHIVALSPMEPLQLNDELHFTESAIAACRSLPREAQALGNCQYHAHIGFCQDIVFDGFITAGVRRIKSTDVQEQYHGWRLINRGFERLGRDLVFCDPWIVVHVMGCVHWLFFISYVPELARALVDYILYLCRDRFGLNHPWNLLITGLYSLSYDQESFSRSSQVIVRVLVEHFYPENSSSEAYFEAMVVMLHHAKRLRDPLNDCGRITTQIKALIEASKLKPNEFMGLGDLSLGLYDDIDRYEKVVRHLESLTETSDWNDLAYGLLPSGTLLF